MGKLTYVIRGRTNRWCWEDWNPRPSRCYRDALRGGPMGKTVPEPSIFRMPESTWNATFMGPVSCLNEALTAG